MLSKIVSLVWCGTASSPGMGGTEGRPPVAITTRRARTRVTAPVAVSSRSVRASSKLADAARTSMPIASNTGGASACS